MNKQQKMIKDIIDEVGVYEDSINPPDLIDRYGKRGDALRTIREIIKNDVKPGIVPCPKCPSWLGDTLQQMDICTKCLIARLGQTKVQMKEHIEKYHPSLIGKLLECPGCGGFFKILHPRAKVCQSCYLNRVL